MNQQSCVGEWLPGSACVYGAMYQVRGGSVEVGGLMISGSTENNKSIR